MVGVGVQSCSRLSTVSGNAFTRDSHNQITNNDATSNLTVVKRKSVDSSSLLVTKMVFVRRLVLQFLRPDGQFSQLAVQISPCSRQRRTTGSKRLKKLPCAPDDWHCDDHLRPHPHCSHKRPDKIDGPPPSHSPSSPISLSPQHIAQALPASSLPCAHRALHACICVRTPHARCGPVLAWYLSHTPYLFWRWKLLICTRPLDSGFGAEVSSLCSCRSRPLSRSVWRR